MLSCDHAWVARGQPLVGRHLEPQARLNGVQQSVPRRFELRHALVLELGRDFGHVDPGCGQRVQLAIVQAGVNTKLLEGHKVTLPILVFLAYLLGTLSIVFLRENVGRRVAQLRALSAAEAPALQLPLDFDPSSAPPRLIPSAPERDGEEDEYVAANGSDGHVYGEPVETAARRP